MRWHLALLFALVALSACRPDPTHGGPGQYRVEGEVVYPMISFRAGESSCIVRVPGELTTPEGEVFVEMRLAGRSATPVRLVPRPTGPVAEGYGVVSGRVFWKRPKELWIRPSFCPIRTSVRALTSLEEAQRRQEAPIVGLWMTRSESGIMQYVGYELVGWRAGEALRVK